MTRDDLPGVFAPVIMPFDEALAPDASRLLRQCRWLVSQGVGIAIFGTNSEANSLSVDEKIELLDRLIDGGIDRSLLMPGTGLCALPDTVRMTAHAAARGCDGALMLPPFYYKGVSDEGLFRAYAEVIERVADERLKIYLYHIPPVSQVPLSPGLIERLVKAYPGTVAGVKNSSGDWQNIRDMLSAGWDNFRV
jgi:4-hydroxy-tetrahydrodipicolinate synthase